VYGPVRTVVWQGSVGDRRPYADQTPMWSPTPIRLEVKRLSYSLNGPSPLGSEDYFGAREDQVKEEDSFRALYFPGRMDRAFLY
jgi:hypothetical protein